jgi:hypothetical protein
MRCPSHPPLDTNHSTPFHSTSQHSQFLKWKGREQPELLMEKKCALWVRCGNRWATSALTACIHSFIDPSAILTYYSQNIRNQNHCAVLTLIKIPSSLCFHTLLLKLDRDKSPTSTFCPLLCKIKAKYFHRHSYNLFVFPSPSFLSA